MVNDTALLPGVRRVVFGLLELLLLMAGSGTFVVDLAPASLAECLLTLGTERGTVLFSTLFTDLNSLVIFLRDLSDDCCGGHDRLAL